MGICMHKIKPVTRFIDMGNRRYKVEITASCERCHKPIVFQGMPAGVFEEQPSTSVDGLEARLNARLIS